MIREAIDNPSDFDACGQNRAGNGMKRIGDLVIACSLIVLTLPLMAMVALIIKLESSGPVLTHEERRTCAGGCVRVWKFRTTRQPQQDERRWRGSDQLTPVGRFLHYTRIVDLPQLYNVVRGEMSLIDASSERPDFFD
jgi:lipopolysaccharide/colanic/teichoic acid biosynthesis glycosyltransferase